MIAVAIVFVCLALLFVVIKKLDDRSRGQVGWNKHADDRISSLEVKDYAQDIRLDNHQKSLKTLKDDVKDLGADVGWDDEMRKTQVLRDSTPPDDDSNPT